MPTKTC